MHINLTEKYEKFYFIGIGGVSMSGLAKYLLSLKKYVGGYDENESENTKLLRGLGVKICTGEDCDSLAGYQVVIYTDAVRDNDKRLAEARKLGLEVVSRGHFLSDVAGNFGKVIAVAGCHGKTTCTSMLTNIFAESQKKYSSHIGGNDLNFGNFYCGGNDYFITEACEYKKNFLLLKANVAVILNSDADHLECYDGAEDLRRSYLSFANGADVSVSLYKDLNLSYGLTFGFDKAADYHAKNLKNYNGMYGFTVCEGDTALGDINLAVYGKHNVLNALAAVAAARSCGLNFRSIRDGLAKFKGVERRFEKLGAVRGVTYIADYAHHPNEIKATLRSAKRICGGRLYVIFQPHTYSRTKNFFTQFVNVLSQVNKLMLYRTFAAREYYDDSGSAFTLSKSIKKSRYGESARDIAYFISSAREGDMVLFLGAGDIYGIAKELVKNLLLLP